MKKWLAIISLIMLAACEKNVDLDIGSAEPLLVVDAQIEDGQPPYVILTKSFNYFSNINAQILANSFVHGADVWVSNGILTQKLKEMPVTLAPGLTAYVYSADLLSPSFFKGEINKNYLLKIISEGKEYSSSTNIPYNAISLDSMWVTPAPMNPDPDKRVLFIKGTDPHGLGNSGRYFTKKNSGVFLPGENSVFDDQVIDGTTFSVQLPQGIDRNDPPKADSNFFAKGDTITLKFCNIPRSTYTFWSTWEFAFQGIGNPFAQPNKVVGNISNGALGAFCGYATQFKKIVAQ